MKQKIIITRKDGYYSIKGNGDAYLLELANGAFRRGEMKRTFWQNVTRFFRILGRCLTEWFDECAAIAFGTEEDAEDVPVIGLLPEEHA